MTEKVNKNKGMNKATKFFTEAALYTVVMGGMEFMSTARHDVFTNVESAILAIPSTVVLALGFSTVNALSPIKTHGFGTWLAGSTAVVMLADAVARPIKENMAESMLENYPIEERQKDTEDRKKVLYDDASKMVIAPRQGMEVYPGVPMPYTPVVA